MPNLKSLFILAPAFLLLSACGGTEGCAPDGGRPLADPTQNQDTCAQTGTTANIAITYPAAGSIEQLLDTSGFPTGVYSFSGSVVVTDKNGNSVPDGTLVQLDVIDSVLAQGTIAAGDSITGTTFTDSNPTITDDLGIGAADFTTAHVNEKGASYFIDSESLVILTSAADRQDQVRLVSAKTANTITVSSAYNSTYPNTTYPSGLTNYIVGRTTLGMKVVGYDPETGETTDSFTRTKAGIGSFRIEYPANANTIRVGCGDGVTTTAIPSIDTRYPTLNTRDVWVRATAADNDAITVADDTACFYHILPQGFTTIAAKQGAGNTYTHTIRLTDANNVGLPFYVIPPAVSGGVVTIADTCITTLDGWCTVDVNGAVGAKITYQPPANAGTGDYVITIE